jgi:hypothetical protein
VSFYRSNGSNLTTEIDEELFNKEPNDIHMVVELAVNLIPYMDKRSERIEANRD